MGAISLGVADVTISEGDRSRHGTCFILPVGNKVLFGRDVITQLQSVSRADVNVVKTDPIEIKLDQETRPVAAHPRRHVFSIWRYIEKELKRLQERDVTEPVQKRHNGCPVGTSTQSRWELTVVRGL
jgi:hypothetical protein